MKSTTRACAHCGRALEPMRLAVGGKECEFGAQPCRCPGAERERAKRLEEENARRGAEEAERLGRRLRKAGIPERYLAARHQSAPAMADAAMAGTGFYIYGPQGTGKTALAMAVAGTLVGRGVGVECITSSDFTEAMRSRKDEDRSLLERLRECRVLVLDDLGKESPTAFACERLFALVNDRYNSMRPVIVTSNFSRGEIASKLAEGDVGRSIASRLVEMTRSIHMEGPDRRLANG